MNGSAELAKLAELCRLGAQTGRQIARLRPHDASIIERLARQAEAMADELDALVAMAHVQDGGRKDDHNPELRRDLDQDRNTRH